MKLDILKYAGLATVLAIAPALGEDYFTDPQQYDQNSAVKFFSSIGILSLEGTEHVYTAAGSSDHLSLLVWQSLSPVLTAGFEVTLPESWTLDADVQIAASGNSYMEDYDWLGPFSPSFAFDDWSHRSQHEQTNLDWYIRGSLAIGYDFQIDESTTVNLNAGLKYIDVQWAAAGGSFIYSIGGFRDTAGVFTDAPGITYRQQLPSVFVGLDTEFTKDNWTFNFGAQAGLTILATATDRHWQRIPPLRFEETIMPAPTAAISARAAYNVNNNLSVFVAGNVEKVFPARSDTTIFNNNTNALLATAPDASGAELFSASLTAGLKGNF
jgi:plasminogen activator